MLGLVKLAAAQTDAGGRSEGEIRGLVQKYVDARNSRDAAATKALFTDDADQLVSTGEWRKGIDSMVQSMVATSQNENAKSSIAVESVRFLDPDVAIADGRYETSSAQSGVQRKMWTALIMKRTPDGWRIAAIRNMLPSAPAQLKLVR